MEVPVRLEIFEGPLDLLMHLIRKNEVDVYDIPVALITSQYLEYLEAMREMNIHVAGEFLVMASTLTHLKSRMLLPSYDSSEDEEEDGDPRLDLVAQLKEHMRFKAAADKLDERAWLGRDVFARGSGHKDVQRADELRQGPEPVEAGLFDLIEAFRGLLSRRGERMDLAIPKAGISIEDRMSQILEVLREKSSLVFEELFSGDRTRADLVVSFLALLELARVGLIKVYQERALGASAPALHTAAVRIFFRDPNQEEAER